VKTEIHLFQFGILGVQASAKTFQPLYVNFTMDYAALRHTEIFDVHPKKGRWINALESALKE